MRKPIGKIRNESLAKRVRRKLSIRSKISGTAARPRLCVSKTNKHIVVQAIDDTANKTLLSVQTYGKNAVAGAKSNRDGAKKVGAVVAEKLKAANVEAVVFDRNGFKFTGVIADLANTVRENGIKF